MHRLLVLVGALLLSACVVHKLEVTSLDVTQANPVEVTTPVKVHLKDGSTAVFANGVSVSNNTVYGNGTVYDLTLESSRPVSEISADDVAAMESYQTPTNTGATAAASVGSTALIVVGVAALSVAIFGSCPTVYSLEPDGQVLEAELFSYSIAPSFQARDIDRLGITSLTDGRFELEIRNEMLETHYIDHIEVLEVLHGPNEKAYPDEKGRPIVAGSLIAPRTAVDQNGRDILNSVAQSDSVAWSSTTERLASVSSDDHLDHLDFEFDVPRDANDIAMVLKLRNSLLNTVLLYDVMLKEQSFGALDWMGRELDRLGNRMETGLWYRKNMGLTISIWNGNRYRKVARLGDQGPIAWSERAISLPSGKDGHLKVRLSFVADNWRFDQVAIALDTERGEVRSIPVGTATTPEEDRPDIPAFLLAADEEYLITRPQDSVRLTFEVGNVSDGRARSFFLASEGYYMEWMRSDWLTQEHRGRFRPGDETLVRALGIYAAKRDGLREQFESTKIEVR
jgi:hypothetical protein